MKYFLSFLILILALLAACRDSSPVYHERVGAYTTKDLYLRPEYPVAVINNSNDYDVTIQACDGSPVWHKDKLVVGVGWTFWSSAQCDNSSSITIPAHSVRQDLIPVGKVGIYRFWFTLHGPNGDSTIVVSNQFQVY